MWCELFCVGFGGGVGCACWLVCCVLLCFPGSFYFMRLGGGCLRWVFVICGFLVRGFLGGFAGIVLLVVCCFRVEYVVDVSGGFVGGFGC